MIVQGIPISNVRIGSIQVKKVYAGANIVWEHFTYDPDLRNVINIATSSGYTLPNEQTLIALNNLITSLKSANLWSRLDRFYVFQYFDTSCENFARIDFIEGLVVDLNGGVTYDNGGFQTNGVNGYLDLKFNPAENGVNYQLNSAQIAFIINSGVTAAGSDDGRVVLQGVSTGAQRMNS